MSEQRMMDQIIAEFPYLGNLNDISMDDVANLLLAEKSYKGSWQRRGGVGAFMMLARKFDRIEAQVQEYGWDIFEATHKDQRIEGIIDDIRDLRRYLLLVEAYIMEKKK